MAFFHPLHRLRRNPVRIVPFRCRFLRFLISVLPLLLAGLNISGCSSISGTPPNLTIVSVKDLGTLPTNPDILGRDGGYSTLFQGYSVWLYGDTFLANPNADNFTLISDSWSYTQDLNAQAGISGFQEPLDSAGAPSMILPETPAEQAFNATHIGANCQQPCGARYALWPASVTVDPATGNALAFYSLVYALPGPFNFTNLGTSVANWQSLNQQPQRPTISPPVVPAHPDLLFNQNEPPFGSASLISNGMLYVYGCGNPANGLDKSCWLGKVAPANILNRSAWSYYAGNGTWTSQLSQAVPVFVGDSILSVSWNSYLQQYVAVYSASFSQSVMIRTAPNPEGPWSLAIVAFTAMQPSGGGNVYDAHAHSEYDANGGQIIYVTYSRSTPAPFTSEVRLVSIQLARSSSQAQ